MPARNRRLLRGPGSLNHQETHCGGARAKVTREHAEGRRYRADTLSGGRDRHRSTEADGEGKCRWRAAGRTLPVQHRRTTPTGRWAMLAPAIDSTETTGATDEHPLPPGNRAAAATSAGTPGDAATPASLRRGSRPHQVAPTRGLPPRARRSRSQRAAAAERAAVGGATVACGPTSGVTRRGGGLR